MYVMYLLRQVIDVSRKKVVIFLRVTWILWYTKYMFAKMEIKQKPNHRVVKSWRQKQIIHQKYLCKIVEWLYKNLKWWLLRCIHTFVWHTYVCFYIYIGSKYWTSIRCVNMPLYGWYVFQLHSPLNIVVIDWVVVQK